MSNEGNESQSDKSISVAFGDTAYALRFTNYALRNKKNPQHKKTTDILVKNTLDKQNLQHLTV